MNERAETDTLKNLRHSYLPKALDFIVTEDAVFTVMDYIPGQSVKDILKERGRLSEQEVIKYAGQLCDALVYLHNSKPPVIHGDIKPVLDIYPMMNRGLADIITRSLEAEPENRFQSFDEIKKILDNMRFNNDSLDLMTQQAILGICGS